MRFVLGVDGGATKTEAAVATLAGEIVGVGLGGGSNPSVVPRSVVEESIARSVSEALAAAGLSWGAEVALLGVAGTESELGRAVLSEVAEKLGLAERVRVVSDALIALAAATRLRPGVILVAGTGSICMGTDGKGRFERSGGWGYLLGDEGSGYWIGLRALVSVMRVFDGRSGPTSLTSMILGRLGLRDPRELVDLAYGRGVSVPEVASLSELVSRAAAEGDAEAVRILRDAGRALSEIAVAVIEKLGLRRAVPVYCVGSVFDSEVVVEALRGELRRRARGARVRRPLLRPVVGALTLALSEAGVKVEGAVERRLLKTAREHRLAYEWARGP